MKPAMHSIFAAVALFAAAACAGSEPSTPSHPPPEQPTEAEPSTPAPEQPDKPADDACGGKTCTPPEQCIRYYGIAGPSLPLFTCGIPCDEQGACPDGKSCAVIADGPRLCR